MTTNHHTPPHQDASKDTTAVIVALRSLADQQVNVLHGYGATPATCERVRDALAAVLMLAVETTREQKRQ